jgi:hypothetical protein
MRLTDWASLGAAWAFVVLFGIVGCGGSDTPPALDAYFEAKPYATPACNGVDQRLAGPRQMRLYSKIGAGAVLPVTQGLASYYHRHSLSFFAAEQVQGTTMAYALDTDQNALSRALVAAFPGVDLNDDAALMADPVLYNQIVTFVANFMLKPMVDFANTHSDLGGGVTNLIVVGQLERPGGTPIGDPGTSLAGLAISPALFTEFARTMPEEAGIWQGVTLPANFTPMMVLGNNVLTRARSIDPELSDLVAAHEFGHTGALVHSEVVRNLMFPGVAPGIDDCTDSLDDAQLALIGASYGLGPSAALQLKRPTQLPPAHALRPMSSLFAPARVRAMLAGDAQATRAFVELLFHGPGPAVAPAPPQ